MNQHPEPTVICVQSSLLHGWALVSQGRTAAELLACRGTSAPPCGRRQGWSG